VLDVRRRSGRQDSQFSLDKGSKSINLAGLATLLANRFEGDRVRVTACFKMLPVGTCEFKSLDLLLLALWAALTQVFARFGSRFAIAEGVGLATIGDLSPGWLQLTAGLRPGEARCSDLELRDPNGRTVHRRDKLQRRKGRPTIVPVESRQVMP
jgi:hypothetical protein